MEFTIEPPGRGGIPDLIPLMRDYCDFYGVDPSDSELASMCESLIENPEEGMQLIARDREGRAVGFATLFWTWQTLTASRVAVMNDLFVAPEARGTGLADALIAACAGRCAERGVSTLTWQTAPDNLRAQAVYDRVGAVSERWIDYSLDVGSLGMPGG